MGKSIRLYIRRSCSCMFITSITVLAPMHAVMQLTVAYLYTCQQLAIGVWKVKGIEERKCQNPVRICTWTQLGPSQFNSQLTTSANLSINHLAPLNIFQCLIGKMDLSNPLKCPVSIIIDTTFTLECVNWDVQEHDIVVLLQLSHVQQIQESYICLHTLFQAPASL